jgi:DNA modification methylase
MIDPAVSAHYTGDCRALLRQLPDGCVQTCVTSPPYWGLRDYDTEGQIGLEDTPEEYVAVMVDVFKEVRRVLKDDGTLWLNLGDCYVTNPRGPGGAASSTLTGRSDSERRQQRWEASGRKGKANPNNRTTDPKVKGRSHATMASRGLRSNLKHKDLVGIPWMTAFALRDAGWYLRMDVIWHKDPVCMPESINDRPTKAHEYLFLFAKGESYQYDASAIAEPSTWEGQNRNHRDPIVSATPGAPPHVGLRRSEPRDTRNKRSVWRVSLQPYAGAHFATFPPDLIEPCILACSRVGDLVLDPFFGSGTTGQVAEKHERLWIGFDLNPKYAELAKERTAQRSLPLSR